VSGGTKKKKPTGTRGGKKRGRRGPWENRRVGNLWVVRKKSGEASGQKRDGTRSGGGAGKKQRNRSWSRGNKRQGIKKIKKMSLWEGGPIVGEKNPAKGKRREKRLRGGGGEVCNQAIGLLVENKGGGSPNGRKRKKGKKVYTR